MRLKALLTVSSIALLSSCATIKKPNVDLMIVNAPGNKRCGYNLERDYDNSGRIKPGAKQTCRPNSSVRDLNKAMVVDSPTGFEDGLAALKAYIRQLREEYERKLQECR